MPSVRCPKCHVENAYSAKEAGNARICTQCGHFIPAQLTGAPTARTARVSAIGEAGTTGDRRTGRVSFASLPRSKTSPMSWLMFAVAGLALLMLIGMCTYWIIQSNSSESLPPITQSATVPKYMTQLTLLRDPPDYIVYFTLLDENRAEVARPGLVQLNFGEISHLAVAGTGSFNQENKLYSGAFRVDATNFSWYAIGGFFTSSKRMVCAIRVPNTNFTRQPSPGREGKLTATFTDGHEARRRMQLTQKFFF